VFISYIHVLSTAFLMGLAVAAPMGPVNMLAIRRGLIGGWRHSLACGIGSVTGDLILFSLVLLGGHYLLSDLSNLTLQTVLAAIGIIVLLPLGIYFLVRSVKEPMRAYDNVSRIDAVDLRHPAVGDSRLYAAHLRDIVLNHIHERCLAVLLNGGGYVFIVSDELWRVERLSSIRSRNSESHMDGIVAVWGLEQGAHGSRYFSIRGIAAVR
jgi:arginine exporter protein ArgO